MSAFTPEEIEILMRGGDESQFTDSIRGKIKERHDLLIERAQKHQTIEKFWELFPNSKTHTEAHKEMFLSLDETQQRLYQVISFELFGGVKLVSECGEIDKDQEFKRVGSILETLFNTHKAVWCYLVFLNSGGDLNKPIKIHFKNKLLKGFIIDLEKTLNIFKKDNIKDEIERLKKLLEFFPKVDAEIRGE